MRTSLRVKLIIIFVLVAAVIGAISFYHLASIGRITSAVDNLIAHDIRRMQILRQIDQATTGISRGQLIALEANDTKAVAAKKAELETAKTQVAQHLEEYQKHLTSDDPQDIDVAGLLRVASETFFAAATDLTQALTQKEKANVISQKRTTFLKVEEDFYTKLHAGLAQEEAHIKVEDEQLDDTARMVTSTTTVIAVLTVIMSALVGFLLARFLARAFDALRQGADRIANGDFSRDIPLHSKDEVGLLAQSFNQMAARLRDSYRRLALEKERDDILLESMGEGVVAIDDKSGVVLINTKASELLELNDRDATLGKQVGSVMVDLYDVSGQKVSEEMLPSTQARKLGHQFQDVLTLKKNDHKPLILSIEASPVVIDGQVAGVVMVLRDVTKEREVDRMKTEFISLASHQLRTPLSAIKWFSEMLLSGDAGKLSPEQMEFSQNISQSTERMIELVNGLLNISRIESGRIIVDPKPTDLRELVSGIVNDLKAKTAEKEQALVISVHKDLPKINIDPHLIGQVYLNLLTNAIKYTPKGGEISVFISRKGDDVVSQVSDNGYGIPKSEHGKVFQKFFRAENVVKIETDGTGLGLYLIKAIIESSGGKIWFESEEGKGTTFWFSLPQSGMQAKAGEVTLDA